MRSSKINMSASKLLCTQNWNIHFKSTQVFQIQQAKTTKYWNTDWTTNQIKAPDKIWARVIPHAFSAQQRIPNVYEVNVAYDKGSSSMLTKIQINDVLEGSRRSRRSTGNITRGITLLISSRASWNHHSDQLLHMDRRVWVQLITNKIQWRRRKSVSLYWRTYGLSKRNALGQSTGFYSHSICLLQQ